MASHARQLLGDLVVASVELVERGRLDDATTESWALLAIATTQAVAAEPTEPALLAELARVFAGTSMLADVAEQLEASLARTVSPMHPSTGFSGQPAWRHVCIVRSGLECLADLLAGEPTLVEQLDTWNIERAIAQRGRELFDLTAVPDVVPAHHWWWHAGTPPERLGTNLMMADLLVPVPVVVPPRFRWTFARPTLPDAKEHRLESFLERDGSLRPVDLAGTALACARWLAYQLRRLRMPPQHVTVRQPRGEFRATMTVHPIRAADVWHDDDLEAFESAVFVLDTDTRK